MLYLSHYIEPVITTGYVVIACQFFFYSRKPHQDPQARKAFIALMVIFILCATTRLTHYFNYKSLALYVFFLHLILAFTTWFYALNREVKSIAEAIEGRSNERRD